MVDASTVDAPAFTRSTPVLRTFLRPAAPRARSRWIAWPTLVWRVVAPDPTWRRPLDVFQRATLRLLAAEAADAHRIAALLGLHPDLTAHLIAGLQHAGFVGARGACTPRGRSALDDDDDARRAPLVSCHVFQDPSTGRLLDRSIDQFPITDAVWRPDDAWPRLQTGSRGRPKTHRLFCVRPSEVRVVEPDAAAIIAALAAHHRAQRDAAARDDLDDAGPPIDPGDTLDRVRVVDEQPRAAWLATWLYVPADRDDGRWRVADPFGLGDAYALRRQIAERARDFGPLADEISKLTGERLEQLDGTLDTWLTALDGEAHDRATRGLGGPVIGQPFEHDLLEMERARLEFERRPDRLARAETAVLSANKALEHAVRAILERWPCPTDRIDRLSDRNKRRNAPLLDEIAGRIGFATPLPDGFRGLLRGQVFWAATRGDGSLARGLAAALIAAEAHPDHPFHALAAALPDALQRIGAMAPERNLAAHARRERTRLTAAELATHIDDTYTILRHLGMAHHHMAHGIQNRRH